MRGAGSRAISEAMGHARLRLAEPSAAAAARTRSGRRKRFTSPASRCSSSRRCAALSVHDPDHAGVVLRELVQLVDGARELVDLAILRDWRRRETSSIIVETWSIDSPTWGIFSLAPAALRAPRLDAVDRGADERADLAGGLRGALRERAHLRSHHRETAALLAGARGFHRGVEREQVGLERDQSMTATISPILAEAALILSMVATTSPTAAPPSCAEPVAVPASSAARRADAVEASTIESSSRHRARGLRRFAAA